jgi:hypothetical protein
VVAVAAVVAQLLAATGFPLPALRGASPGKRSGVPFPCRDLPCGCATAEQCWAGPCCCFTMREKVAWAAEHGFTPPEHAVRLAEDEAARGACPKCRKNAAPDHPDRDHAKKPCCDTNSAPAPRSTEWVIGVFAKKCRGDEPGAVWVGTPGVPPGPAVAWAFDRAPAGIVPPVDHDTDPTTSPPPTPPPRS